MDFNMILKLLIMACGIYMVYWAIQMKSTNKIPEMLVGRGFPLNRAKDPEGFMKSTFPFTIGTGVLLFVSGMIGALEIFILYPWVDTVITIITLVVLGLYGTFLLKAQKKYLIGVTQSSKKDRKKK